jgi:hypothetical protein
VPGLRREAGAHARGEVELIAAIEADDQRIESEVTRGVASDYKLLRQIDSRRLPKAPYAFPADRCCPRVWRSLLQDGAP